MEEVAWFYSWQPSEIYALGFDELLRWHEGARRIRNKTNPPE